MTTDDPARFRSADGTPALDFARMDGQEALAFIMGIAIMRLDGEGADDDEVSPGPYVVENDHAWETYHDLVRRARQVLGWEAGQPPLDHPDYLEYQECGEDGEGGSEDEAG